MSSAQHKNHKAYKKKSMVLSEGKSDTTESVPEKDLMVNMLDKDFKTAALDIPEN